MRRPARPGDLGTSQVHDVCIIGSGFTGATLGLELTGRGLDTVILESGINMNDKAGDPRYFSLDQYRTTGDAPAPRSISTSTSTCCASTTSIARTGRA